jgi:hypothetical protein
MLIKILSLTTTLLILGGCTSSTPSYHPQNQKVYKKGFDDGCKTANGDYTKSHHLFNDNLDYHEGWFSGRKECNH